MATHVDRNILTPRPPAPCPTPARRNRTGGPSGSVVRRLYDDWAAMASRPATVRRARTWSLGVEFDDLDGLVAAVGYRPRPSADADVADLRRETAGRAVSRDAAVEAVADEALRRLVLAARADELAARVVLQRLLPGLTSAARRWGGSRRGGSDDALDEIVSAAWLVIRTYPVERRPTRLAAKLLRDAEHQAFVKATRRRWSSDSVEPASLDRCAAAPVQREPAEELAEVVAASRAALSTDDVTLLRLLCSGRTVPEVAAELQVSVRTVGYHRDALVHRLRTGVRVDA